MVPGHQALGLYIQPIQVVGSTGELLVLVVFAHKGLYQSDGADVLLHALVQFVVLRKHLLEQSCHA